MITSLPVPLPLASPVPVSVKKRRVLLVDASPAKRDLRAETMRKLGMEVDCAADISEARCWWRADLYNLVLINVENDLGHRDKFCDDIRGATPPQQFAFLVGKPEYLAGSPHAGSTPLLETEGTAALLEETRATPPVDVSPDLSQRWGILEASRRISAVRSVAIARSRAVQSRPAPPRDLETRYSKRIASRSLDDLLKEEMQ